jgi:hypothetical protein
LQAAQAQVQTKACKRVYFSPAPKEIHFFLSSLLCFIFCHLKPSQKQLDRNNEKLYRQPLDNDEGKLATAVLQKNGFSG